MSFKHCLSLFLLILGIVVLNTRVAKACSCAPSGTVLDAYERANVVIIATVKSVDKPEGDVKYVDGVRSTTVTVERVFKGNLKIGDEMIFAQGGGADCIWTFKKEDIGAEILFYLNGQEKNPRVWFAVTCGRSSSVKYAGDDLLYLENMEKVRGKTRISGTLQSYTNEDLSFAGRRIRIIGKNKTYEVKTNRDGVYELYDAPPGQYLVEPEIPLGWKINSFYFEYSSSYAGDRENRPTKQIPIVLEKKKHANLDLVFVVDNAIRGKVYDPNGNLMKDVCLNLVPANDRDSSLYKADCTEEDGTFKIDEIPSGSYLLAINRNGKISSDEPFRTFYYPNVTDPDKAAVLAIAAGGFLDDMDIHVPRMEETITIDGVFLYSDGKPVVEESIEFKAENADPGIDGDARTRTDASGRFSIKILKGLKGQLHGEMYAYIGEFENCPKLEAAIRKNGGTMSSIQTTPTAIFAENNLYDVELKLAYPGCKKAK